MDRGELVPDELTLAIVMERLEPARHAERVHPGRLPTDCGAGAGARRAAGSEPARQIDRVIDLVVPDDVLLARLSGRWLCANCHASYHTVFSPPTVAGICDRCGGPLYQRSGRHPGDGARTAWRCTTTTPCPVLDYYRARGSGGGTWRPVSRGGERGAAWRQS